MVLAEIRSKEFGLFDLGNLVSVVEVQVFKTNDLVRLDFIRRVSQRVDASHLCGLGKLVSAQLLTLLSSKHLLVNKSLPWVDFWKIDFRI